MRLGAVIVLGFGLPLSAQTPNVNEGGVGNSATGAATVAPGSLVSIFGSELASSTAVADSIPLSTSLANVSVTFNDVPAPLHFVSPGQINAQLPWDTLPAGMLSGTANVVVTRAGASSAPREVSVGPFSPGIYSFNNLAIAINPDGTLAQPVGSIPGLTTRPAQRGEFLILLATGLGAVSAPIANGASSQDQLRTVLTPPIVTVGGITTPVAFAGLSPDFVGIYQVNTEVAQTVASGDALPLQFQVGGITSPDTTTIAVGN
ncbi:MAG: hypothetical protein KIT09_11870 [Bryobacteraceae bacterium]|nr:hypothetical protein [Bryobacteraceae bacterium]